MATTAHASSSPSSSGSHTKPRLPSSSKTTTGDNGELTVSVVQQQQQQQSRVKRVENVTTSGQLVAALSNNRVKLVEDRFQKLQMFLNPQQQMTLKGSSPETPVLSGEGSTVSPTSTDSGSTGGAATSSGKTTPMTSPSVPPATEEASSQKGFFIGRVINKAKEFCSQFLPESTSGAIMMASEALNEMDIGRAEEFRCTLLYTDKAGQRALQSLAIKMIDNFLSTPSKTPALIREIVQLARVDDREVVQMLVTALANTIDQNVLFDVPMIEGLAEVLFQCSSRHIPVENLVVIYRMLIAKIETLHSQQQNADRVFQILKGFNKLLRAMWASGVRGLDEEDKKKSLGILQAMKDRYANYKSLECYVAAEAEVAKQNLQRIQDDGDPLADVAARLGHAYMAVGAIANLAMQYDIREVFNCVSELKECVADIYIKKSWMDVLFFIDLMLWQLTVGSKELKPMPPEEQERLKNAIQHIYSESRKVGILHSEELREDADAAKKEEATAAEPPSTSSESAKHGVIMGALAKAGNKVKETILTTAHTLKRKASEITSQLNAIIEGEHDFSLGYVNLLDNVIKAEPLLDNIDMKNWALDQLKGILVGEDYRESTLMKFFNSEVGLMMVVISKLREYSTMPPPIGNTAWQILVDVMAFIHVEEAKTQANRDIKNGINFGLARYSQRRKFDKVSSALKRPTLVYISDEEQWLYVVPKATGAPPDYTYVLRLHSPPSPKEQPPTEVISCFDDKLNKSETVYSAHAKGILNPVKLNFLFFMKTHPVPPTPPASGAFANIHPIFQFKMLIPPTKPQTVGVEDTLCTSELFMKAKAEVLATLKDSVDDQVMDLRKRTLEDPQLESLLKTYVESDCRETVLDKVAQPLKETLFKKFLNLEPPAMSQSHRHHSGRSHSSSSSSSSSSTTGATETTTPTKTLVLVGSGGTGKSIFGHFVEKLLWESYDRCHVIPIFISLATIKNPSKNLFEKTLTSLGFSQSNIDEIKEGRRVLFILDGYDEITLEVGVNICQANKLCDWKHSQVLVSSRPEKIEQDFFQSFCCLGGARIQGNKSVSTASSPSGNKDVSQSEVLCWYIEPFTPDKIKAYVKKYAQFGGSQGERSAELFNQHRELLKGVEDLLRTPFILTMFMEILPTLVDKMEQDRSRKRFDDSNSSSNSGNSSSALSTELSSNLTRLELYDRFVEQWFQRQKSKITPERMAQCTQHLTDDVEEVKFNFQVGGDIIEDFRSFSENLAIFMFTKGATALQYSPVWTLNSQGVEVIDQNNPLERFFSPTNRSTQLVLSGCLIQRKGANTFMFLHKSLQEYFIAYKIYKEIQLCSSMPFSNFPQVKCRETIKFMQSNYRETAHEIVSAIVEEISEKVQWLPAVEGHDEYTKFFETMMGPTDNVSEPADDPFYGVKMIFKQHKDALLLMAHPPPLVLAEVSIHDHKMEYMPQFACDWATQGMSYCWACDCCQAVRESWNPDANGWYCYKCDFKICKDCFLEYRVLPPSTSTPSESNSATPIVGTTSGDEETAVAKQQIPPESTSSGKAATSSTVTATNTDDSASTAATSDQQQEENFKRLREILAKILSAIGGRQRLDKWMKKIKEAHSHPEAQKGSSIDKEKVIADILEEMSSSRTTEVSSVKEACESVLSRTLKPEMHLEEEVDYTVTKNNFRPSLSVVIDLRRRLRKMQAAKEQGRRTKVVKYPKELLINQYTLVKVNDVIRFLLEMMRRDDAVEDAFSLRKALLLLVENSKWTNRSNGNNKARLDRADRAASTAMMLLIQGKQNFSNVDLRCIHINSADLSSGIFGGADLVRADFSDCKMGQVWLCGADLRNCNMTGVSFNERVAFDFGVGLACVDVTVDGTRLCACPRNKGHPLLCDVNDEDLEFKEVGPEVKCDQCKFSPDGKKICLVVHEEHHQSVLVLDIPSNTCVNVDLPKSMELKKGSASSKTGISSALCGSSAAVIKSICFSSDSTVLTISKEVEERSATFIFSLPAPASPDGSVKETTTAVTESAQAGVVVLPQHVLDGCFAHFFIGSSLLLTTNKSPPFWGVPGELSSTPPPLKDTPTNIGSGISMFAVSPTRNKLAGFSKQTGKVTVWEFSEKDLHSFHMLFEHQVSDPRFFSVLSFSPKGTWLLAGTQLLHVESQSVNCDVAQKCFFTGEDTLGYLGDSQIYEIKALPRNLQVTESWPCHCIAACKSKVLTATRRPAKAKETDSKRHSRSSSAKSKEKGTSEPGKHPPSDEERGEHVEDAETSPEWGFVHEMWTSDGLKKLPLPNGFDMANTLNSHLCFSSDGRFLAGCDSSTVFVWDLNSGAVVQHNNTLTGHDIKALAFFPSKEAEVAVKLGIALTRKKGTAEENNTKGSDTTGEERFVVFSDQDIPMDPHNLFCVLNLIFGGNRGPEREGDDISSMETGGVSTPNLVAEQPIKLPLQRVDWNSVVVSPSWKSVILLTTNPNQESNITMIIDQEAHTITRVESNPSPVFIFPEVTADGLISPEILHYSFSYDSVRKHLTDKIGFPNSESRIQLFLTERILYALDLNLVLGGGLIANSCDPEININFLKEQPREEIGYFEKKLITIVKDGPWCLLLKGEVAAIATVNSTILFWQLVYPRRCVLTLGPFSGQIFSLTAAGDNMLVVVAGRDIHFIRVEPGVWRDIDVTLVHRTGHTMQPLVAAYASVQTVKGLTVESKSLLKSRAIIGALKMEREVDPSVVLAQVEKLKSVVWTSAQSKPKQMPKFLGLFFSNYSNPRGKKCTTTLREQYESLIQEQPKNTFSIIEISCDRSARLFKTNAPRDVNGWSHLQFDERELQETLVDLFDVTPCEPTIVVLNPQQGEVVAKHSLHVLFKAFAHLKFPWSVDSVKWMRFKSHKHPLELRSSPQFVCSECSEPGSGLEYHCELDSLDFHPRCTSGAYELPEWILYEGDEHPVRLDRESPRIGYTCKRCSSTFVIEVCLDSPEVEPPPKPNTPFSWSMFDGHETPLQLVFKSGSYQCGQCKKKKEQGGWVYHCPKRGLYFEPSCIGEPHGLSKWVKVEVHKHPLKLGGSQSNVLCSLCSKYFSGQNYACPVCEGEDAYLVEVECIMKQSYETLPDPVSEPNNWKKFAEHPHLLKMVFMKDFQCCQCEKPGSCWALECKVCKPEGVYFHPQCAGEPHELPKWVLESGESAHPHPLSLKSRRCEESCNKCEAIRQEQFYYCKLDKHTLHVGCCLSATELPDVEGKPLTWKKCNQDTHPVQLVLSSGEFTCHHCNKPKPGPAWAYKCHTENVFFHVECLENPQNPQKWIILNSKHKHPLQFGKAPKDLSGVCCACGDGGEGKEGGVYFCSSCHAFCHVGCSGASTPLPPMINVRTHKHPLELKEAAPPKPQGEDEDDDDNNDEEEGTDNEELRCAQCSGLIEGGQEHYYRCTKCPNMVVHVGCCTRPLPFGAKSSSGTRGVQRSNRHHHDEDDDEDENDKGQEEEEEEEENEDGGSLGAVRAKADKGKEKADHDEQRP